MSKCLFSDIVKIQTCVPEKMNIFFILYIRIEYLAFYIYRSLTCGGKGGGLGREGFQLTDAFYASPLQVYPTTMRALGMGTGGSRVALVQWWRHLCPRYSPGVSVGRIRLREAGKEGPGSLQVKGLTKDLFTWVSLRCCFPIVWLIWLGKEAKLMLPVFQSIACIALHAGFRFCWTLLGGGCKRHGWHKELGQLNDSELQPWHCQGCNRKTAQKCREAAPGCKDVALGRLSPAFGQNRHRLGENPGVIWTVGWALFQERNRGGYGAPHGHGSSEGQTACPSALIFLFWPREMEIPLSWLQPKIRVRLGPGWAWSRLRGLSGTQALSSSHLSGAQGHWAFRLYSLKTSVLCLSTDMAAPQIPNICP